MFKHSKKLLFSLPVGRQNSRAPLPVHSNFDAHLLGWHSSQTMHKKYRFYVPQSFANTGFTPNRSCKDVHINLTSSAYATSQMTFRRSGTG